MDAERSTGFQGDSGIIPVAVKKLLLMFELMLLEADCSQEEADRVLVDLKYTLMHNPDEGNTSETICESVGPCPKCEEYRKKMREYMKVYRRRSK